MIDRGQVEVDGSDACCPTAIPVARSRSAPTDPRVQGHLIENDIADWNATSEVVAVFHTNAGHVALHDSACNADRNVATGNPYKELLVDVMSRGAHVELCGATAKAHHWGVLTFCQGSR